MTRPGSTGNGVVPRVFGGINQWHSKSKRSAACRAKLGISALLIGDNHRRSSAESEAVILVYLAVVMAQREICARSAAACRKRQARMLFRGEAAAGSGGARKWRCQHHVLSCRHYSFCEAGFCRMQSNSAHRGSRALKHIRHLPSASPGNERRP